MPAYWGVITFHKHGYEIYEENIPRLNPKQNIEFEIELEPKKRWKRFQRSLLFPGQGQQYKDRKFMASCWTIMTSGTLSYLAYDAIVGKDLSQGPVSVITLGGVRSVNLADVLIFHPFKEEPKFTFKIKLAILSFIIPTKVYFHIELNAKKAPQMRDLLGVFM